MASTEQFLRSHNVSHNITILRKLDAERLLFVWPVIAYVVLLMTTGILGNGLVCYIHGKKIKRSTANNFILWLAAIDLFTCSVGMPMELYDIIYSYTFDNPALCKTIRFVIYLSVMTSVATLVFIALERYFKICRPLKVSPIRRCRLVILISLCGGLMFAWPCLALFGRKKMASYYPDIYGVGCGIDDSVLGTVYPQVYFMVLGTAFLTGAIAFILLYVVIGRKIFRRNRQSIGVNMRFLQRKIVIARMNSPGTESTVHKSHPKLKRKDSRYNLSRTSVIFCTISVVFVVSFLPSLALMTTSTISTSFSDKLTHAQYVVYSIFLRMYFINNCVNPIIYGFLHKQFRQECVNVFTKC